MAGTTKGLTFMSEGRGKEGKHIECQNIWFATDPPVKLQIAVQC